MTQLAAYYPESKLELEAVLDGYFEDLQHLTLAEVRAVFVAARRRCRFFPKIVELLEIVESLQAAQLPACHHCPRGHGLHTGHAVRHYPAGPWCATCATDMPLPSGYVYHAPVAAPAAPLQLPEQSETPLTREEAQAVIAECLAIVEHRAAVLHTAGAIAATGRYQTTPTLDETTARHAELQTPAAALRDGTAPSLEVSP